MAPIDPPMPRWQPYGDRFQVARVSFDASGSLTWALRDRPDDAGRVIGAVQAQVLAMPPWFTQPPPAPVPGVDSFYFQLDGRYFMGTDVGYHSSVKNEFATSMDRCDYLPEGTCFYDGSSLRGMENGKMWADLGGGDDFWWDFLETEWHHTFDAYVRP